MLRIDLGLFLATVFAIPKINIHRLVQDTELINITIFD